jgi:hypothetical protein
MCVCVCVRARACVHACVFIIAANIICVVCDTSHMYVYMYLPLPFPPFPIPPFPLPLLSLSLPSPSLPPFPPHPPPPTSTPLLGAAGISNGSTFKQISQVFRAQGVGELVGPVQILQSQSSIDIGTIHEYKFSKVKSCLVALEYRH